MKEIFVILRLQGIRQIIREYAPQLRPLGKSEGELFEFLVAHYIRDEMTNNLDLFTIMTLNEADTLEEEIAVQTLFECYEAIYQSLKFKNHKTINNLLAMSTDIIIENVQGDALHMRCTAQGTLLH